MPLIIAMQYVSKVAKDILEPILYNAIQGAVPSDYIIHPLFKEFKEQTKEDIERAISELKELAISTRATALVTLGESAMTIVTGRKNITKERGIVSSLILGKNMLPIKVVPAYDTNYASYDRNRLIQLGRDIYKAYCISKGENPDHEASVPYRVCRTMRDVKEAILVCEESRIVSFDFETTEIAKKGKGTFDPNFKATCVSIAANSGYSYCIPLEHKDSPFTKTEIKVIFKMLDKHLMSNYYVRKVAHNLDFDRHVLRAYGYGDMLGRLDDTMLIDYHISEDRLHGLDEVVNMYAPSFSGYWSDMAAIPLRDWHTVDGEILYKYNAIDAAVILAVLPVMEKELMADERVYLVYRNLTMAAFKPLWQAEADGMPIDAARLQETIDRGLELIAEQDAHLRKDATVVAYTAHKKKVMRKEMVAALQARYDAVWASKPTHKGALKLKEKIEKVKTAAIPDNKVLSFSSSKQCLDLFFSPYGFNFRPPVGKKAAVNKKIIKMVAPDNEFVNEYLTYKSMVTVLGTFLVGNTYRMDENGRLHTTYKLHGTETGRLASANPNLQNIPSVAKTNSPRLIELVQSVKSLFIPPDGYELDEYDYSQGELRIIAEFANETNMLKVYADDGDIHATTAAAMMGIDDSKFKLLDDITKKEKRKLAKAVNFGLIYGMAAPSLVEYSKTNYNVTMTIHEAEMYIHRFFKKYPRLLDYHSDAALRATRYGYVRTLFGTKRHTPDMGSPIPSIASMDKRAAINSPVQGTLGQYMIFAIAIGHIRLSRDKVMLANTVHDSLLHYRKKGVPDSYCKYVLNMLENLPTEHYFGTKLNRVLLKADYSRSTTNWLETKEYSLK